jgi:hypothetical protein
MSALVSEGEYAGVRHIMQTSILTLFFINLDFNKPRMLNKKVMKIIIKAIYNYVNNENYSHN